MSRSALYVYAVVPDTQRPFWGAIGLDGASVRSVAGAGCAALVHDAPAAAYQGTDDQIKVWLLEHVRVVERAWEECGTVLPVAFNTLVDGRDDLSAEARLHHWLCDAASRLAARLMALRGRVELKVAITLDAVASADDDPEVQALRSDLAGKPAGLRRLLERKVERLEQQQANKLADRLYREYRRRIAMHAEELIEQRRTRSQDGSIPVLTVAVLLPATGVEALGAELAAFHAAEPRIRIRFLGPWPPYSFAHLERFPLPPATARPTELIGRPSAADASL